ncbi:carboxypeptidase-like regulatory domain-containing protein [Flavobacterium tegetincola]|uniref:carboxypeptidase-like regulatory domain-containing protein n=1 Tax=Flavobacterium tegetincola TaxID=150172 RepID=UPI00047A9F69|nr:carboxypeptidase-like regulatory domain-containing protein [Flavobacterium tegetincola]
MSKQITITLLLLIGFLSLSSCISDQNKESCISGRIQDELGNPLEDVIITYRNSLITTQTDVAGNFEFNQPRTLFIDFKKEGYQTLSTKINNFSEDAFYNFNTITLNKITSSTTLYKDISLNTDSKFLNLKFYGTVLNSFGQPLKDVNLTLIDSTVETYSMKGEGHFEFKIFDNAIAIEKQGFRKFQINQQYYEKEKQSITLLETSQKSGIYVLKEGKYIALPKAKLIYKSEEKIGSVLWGGNFAYNITDFYYPKNAKEFKIENDSIVRFLIFEPNFSSGLFEAQNEDGFLGTADYKLSQTPFPDSKAELLPITKIYPPKNSTNSFDAPKIIDFKPSSRNKKYVFVNSKSRTGFYFKY